MTEKKPKEVRIYTRPDCQYCDYTKELLTEAGVPFREIDVSTDYVLRGWLAWATNQRTLPQVFIGGELVGGYADLMSLIAVGSLHRMVGIDPPAKNRDEGADVMTEKGLTTTNQQRAMAPQEKQYYAIRDFMNDRRTEIKAAAGDQMNPERLRDLALLAIKADEKLLACSAHSLLSAVLQAAKLGLEPTGRTGGGYLIPFKGQAQFVTDYRGEITLCVRSGFCSAIKPVIVHEKDLFDVREGSEQRLIHRPDYKAPDRGPEVLVYAVAKMLGGEFDFEVLPFAEIERRRKMSKMGTYGPWKDHHRRMALKSAVRAIANRMAKSATPKDRQVARAYLEHVDHEEDAEFNGNVTIDVDPNAPPQTATDDLAAKVAAKRDESAAWEEEQKRKFEEGDEPGARG